MHVMRREMKSKMSAVENSPAHQQGRHRGENGRPPGGTLSRRHALTHMQQKGPEGDGQGLQTQQDTQPQQDTPQSNCRKPIIEKREVEREAQSVQGTE